ncbi:MAG TPA: helix-turn-helix domain-containing protein [Clostridiales bacterium]|nr:helix-turn-helix domain-containing protein [Clostridiales bacterium]
MKKRGAKNKIYSAEFKIAVIMDMRNNHLGYRETARKYNIAANDSQGKDRLKDWERIYLEEGAEGLMTERRGRKSTGRPKKKLDKSVEEDLIAENQRLRMELEYLKKLSALVLAEEQEKNKKQ